MRRAAVVAVAAALAAPPAQAASTSSWSTAIRSADGTSLATKVFRPAGLEPGARTPVILIVGPYFSAQTTGGSETLFYYQSLFDAAVPRGYTIVQVALRGYGGSGGCSDFKGPGEQADARAAVEWAAAQPWSTGRVGMYGLSYDAATQVMALGGRAHGLAAAVTIEAGTTGYGVMYMNGIRYVPFGDTYEGHNALYWAPPPESALAAGGHLATDPECLAGRLASERDPDPGTDFWRARDLAARARHSPVPVFYVQGFLDANAHPDGFLPLWSSLDGPKHAWLGQFPHVIPGEADPFTTLPQGVGRDGFLDEAMRWFDRYLKDAAAPPDPAVEVQDGGTGAWRAEPAWPPADARAFGFRMLPGAYADVPGNKGEPYCFRVEGNCLPGRTGIGAWTFSQPLPYDVWLAGAPSLSLRLDTGSAPAVHLVALLYDVDDRGQAALVSRGATLAGGDRSVGFELYPQDWRLRRGHRIAVLVSGADDGWFEPPASGATARFPGGTLTLPVLRFERARRLAGGPSLAMRQRSTFAVPASSIEGRTLVQALPPPLAAGGAGRSPAGACPGRGRLRLAVRPRRVRAGTRTRFRFRVTALPCTGGARRARRAVVRFAGARVKTDRRGRASLVRRVRRPGRHAARASLRGYARARAVVSARR